jgi:DNA-binding IclR family transcriptional regulator
MSSSAKRTLKVLSRIAASAQPLGVTEIARQLDAAPGTVFRALDALLRSEFAIKYQQSSRYVLGPAAARLRQTVFAQFPIRDSALPYLRQLASATGETASLIVPLGWYGVRIASARGSNEVTSAPQLGPIGPLSRHYGSRAILALLSEAKRDAYFAWAAMKRIQTEKDSGLRQELARIRAAGLNHDSSGPAAFALPVRHGDEAIAAIAIEGPVLDRRKRAADQVEPWAAVVRAFERVVAQRPEIAVNPFGHLDPGTIALEQM